MTQNQIAYKSFQEQQRSNYENERLKAADIAEKKRSNLEKEFQEYGPYASGAAKDAHWGSYRPDDTSFGSDRIHTAAKWGREKAQDIMSTIFPFKFNIGGK